MLHPAWGHSGPISETWAASAGPMATQMPCNLQEDRSEMKNSLELRAALLALIDKHRTQTGDWELGINIERIIVHQDMRDLERDILKRN